jgi:hypothetical protein
VLAILVDSNSNQVAMFVGILSSNMVIKVRCVQNFLSGTTVVSTGFSPSTTESYPPRYYAETYTLSVTEYNTLRVS